MNLYPPPHSTLQLSPAWSLRILPAALLPALLLILTLGAAPPAQAQTIVNICERTPAVEDSILASVQVRTDDCAEVTDSMLAGITNLNLSYRGITALQAGDFAGLTAMTSLSLNGNSLTTLPAGIFSDLTALNVLDLSRNLLTKDLPPTVFSGLTALRTLNLNNNRMSELPARLFNGLTALRTLNLRNGIGEIRSISSLPAGIFDDLTALSSLDLSFNRLTTDNLPPGVFSNLASLNSLKLNKNSLARLPDTAFSGFKGQLSTLQGGSQDPGGSAFYGPIRIDVYLNQIGNTVTATVPAGAFKELKVYLAISSDDAMSTTPTTATITLPVGELTGSLVLSPSGGETLTAGFANIQRPVEHPGLSHTESGGRIQSLRFVLGTNVAGFCDRTAAVRDALLALAQVSNNCYKVTPGQLVGVTTLDLSSQSISALKAGDFAGLTAMTGLNLSGNSLATLPAGVFSGLPALVSLDLGGNQFTDLPNDTFTGLTTALTTLSAGNQTSANANTNLPLYLNQIGNTVTATLPTAAFAATTANLTVSSDDTNVADITQTISIPVGQTSGSTTLVPTSGDTLTAAFDATTPLTFAGITPTGLSIATPSQELAAGFCSRTTEVQAAIITAIGGSPAETCDTVTSAHLAGIGTLDLSNLGITTLRTGDFAGLTTVTEIDLSDNSGLTALPTNLFADLGTVTTLDLSGSGLSALSADTFSGLTALQTLDLSDNSITSLLEGAGAFSSLAALQTLHLNDNAIQIVPTGAFNGLAALQTLNLGDNAITSLDATALDPLAALTSLDLSNNKLFRPPANSFSGPTLLETLDLSDNIIYRLDANIFSSLAALQTLHLNDNGIVSLFATTFSGLTALQTLDLSDNILNALPAGIFNPLVALSSLDLSDNNLPVLPNDTFTGFQPSTQPLTSLSVGNQTDADSAMRVYLFLAQDGNTVTATLPAGAPANLTLNLSVISSGGGAPTTDTIDMAAGETTATTTLVPTGSETLTADFAATNPLTFTGTTGTPGTPALTLTGADIRPAASPVPGFCNRTPGVRDGVLAVVSADDCTLVTYPMLAGISGELDLSVASSAAPTIISLKDGDFEGLTTVSTLNLQNQALGTLPSGIFNDLTALTALDLSGNNLVTLPDDTFTTGFPSTLTELSVGDQTSSDDNMKIRVYLRQVGTTVTATLPSGAFTPTNVNLSLTDSGGGSATTATIPLATAETSKTLTVSSTQTAAFASANLLTYTGTPALTVTGADIVSTVQVPGFCNRTAQVQTTILATSEAAAANNNCLEVSPDMLAAITILNLGRTGITTLQAGDFDGLTALQTLKLNDNSITSNSTTPLPAGLFDGLTSLQNLFLAGNRGITALPEELLDGLTSLQNFYLNHTGVTTLPEDFFDGLSSLQDIYLNHSRITSLPDDLFDGLSSLEVLHIHTNSLPSLPAGIFAGLSSLTDLQLYSNQLTALPANLFNGLSSLQNLYLNNNSIASLPEELFDGLSSLQNLYLNNNSIASLPEDLFDGLSSLQNLYLNNNSIASLPAGLFAGLSSLADLRLGSNQLATLPEDPFDGLTALTALHLENNDIATLPNDIFTGFSATLGTLRLQAQTNANVAMKVPLYLHQVGNVVIANIRAGAPAALTVNLSVTSSGGGAATTAAIVIPVGGTHNSITLVPTGGETLTAAFAATPATLDIADLQGVAYETGTLAGGICSRTPAVQNKLQALAAPTFCDQVDATDLAGITTLDLSNAGIESLQASDFADLTELTTLNLSGNSLTALPSGIFTALAKVTTLNLSGNRLTTPGLDTGDPAAGIFTPLTAMTGLDLSNNRLTALPAGIFTFGTNTGKSALTNLDLSSQSGLGGNLRMSLQPSWDSGTAMVTLEVPSGVPAALTVILATADSGVAGNSIALTVPLGATSVSASLTGTAVTLGPSSSVPGWNNGITVATGLDFSFGICDRTMQVQAALLARARLLTGVDSNIGCGGVTDTMLAKLGTAISSNPGGGGGNILDLQVKTLEDNGLTPITALQANDFAGLSGFTFLYLQGNDLTELPVGVFNGLTAVTSLSLQENKIATIAPGVFNPMPLSSGVDLSSNELAALPKDLFTGRTAGIGGLALGNQFDDTDDNRVTQPTMDIPVFLLRSGNRLTLTVPPGAPNALTVNLTITSSPANTTSTQTITIPVGRTTATANLTPASGQTLSANFASSNPFSHSSLTFLGGQFVGRIPGICNRSPAVQTAIIADPQVTATSCEDVSDDMLSAITGTLDLSDSITALRAGDLAMLTGLTGLNLSDNGLTALPAGIFDDLVALTTLDLSDNRLTTLPASIFNNLLLATFDFSGNQLTANVLDSDDPTTSIFAPLTALTSLDLSENEIKFLPDGIFAFGTNTKKSALTNLDLRDQNGLDGNLQLILKPTGNSSTNTVAVEVPAGVPAALTVPLTVTDSSGTLSQTLTMPAGATTITDEATLTGGVTVTTAGTPSWASGTTIRGLGFTFGICDRTEQVQALLLAYLNNGTTCSTVTDAMLNNLSGTAYGGLNFNADNRGIFNDLPGVSKLTSLKANDFAGLSSIESVSLRDNNLTELPAGVFNGLSSVQALYLSENKIATIAPFVLKPLTNLRFTLSLGQNALSALPKDFFTGQTQRLRQLLLSNQFADPDDGIPTAEFIDIPVHLLQDGSHLTLTVPTGSPVDLTVNLTITSSPANTTSTESIVIPIGQTTGTATLTPATGQTLSAAFASADPFSYSDTVYSSDPGLPTSTLTFEGGRFVGQILGICNRSPAVQIALLAKVPATVCSGVSDTMLRAVTGALDLSSASLSALLPIDFDLLTALQELNLSDNSLATLPDGIFDDLRSLTKLDLSGNHMATGALTITAMTPGDPATSIFAPLAKMVDLDLSDNRIETLPDGIFTGFPRALTKFDLSSQNDSSGTALGSNLKMLVKPSWASGTITVSVPTGVPASMVLMFDAVGGEADAINVTVPSNTTTGSAALAVSAPSTTVWLSLSAAPTFSGATITGLDLETGICGRNAAVQAKLVAAITLSKNCAEIDATDLATITTTLDLSNLGIAALDAGDLADLTEVPTLNLTGNALTTLPEDVFKDLGKVTALTLTNNKLSDSASSVFANMAALTALNIEGNEFSILPANFFKGLRNELHIDAGMQFNDNPDSGGSDIAEADSIMTLSLVKDDSNEVTVDFPAATFADLTVTLDLTDATQGSTGTVEVLAGTNSNATPLSLTASGGNTPTAAINLIPPATVGADSMPNVTVGADNTPSVTGIAYEIVEPGICDRTMQVQIAILALVTPTNCAEVSNSILNDITGTLDLSSDSLSALQVGDFDDLIKLQTLNLSSNSLSTLPAGIFTELDAMTSLNLSGNAFVSLTGLFADLGGITTLNLSDNKLEATSVPARIFAPLLAMTSLDLSGNKIAELPNEIFAGLTAALNTKLDVSGQFRNDSNTANINNFDVLLDLSVDASNVATVTIPTGAPQALTVNLDLTGHDTSSSPPSPTSVTIAIGATSGTATLIPATSGGTVTAILNATPPTLTATTGITLITGAEGICNRNEVVEAALLAKIGGGATCDSVTESILNSLSGTLDLSVASGVTPTITATNNLADSDFADLILIDTVDLGNQGLTTIAAGLFDAMTSLATLDLSGNSLSALPTRIFDDLVVLTNLNLSANQIASLDADAFTGLALLEVLNLSGNALAALPAALLSSAPERPLTKLAELDLSENKLTSLPATLLNGLTSIGTIKLVGNLLTSLPDGFFKGTISLAALSLENQGNDTGETALAAIPLTLRPQVTGTTASVLLATGAPTALTLTLSVTDGGSTSNSAALTILAGATTSSTVTVSSASAMVSPNAPTYDSTNFTGLTWVTGESTTGDSGICERTPAVRDALLALINGSTQADSSTYKTCGDVVTADLNGLSGTLDLSALSIATVLSTDFADLTGITSLDLSDNSFTALTDGLFAALTALTSLDLSTNQLTSLGASTFTGLTKLTTLNLRANQLREARIDAATLAPLTALTGLDLHGNELTGLPDSLFSGVSTLTSLDLRDQFSNDDQIPDLPTVTLSLVPLVQDTTVQVQAPSGAPTDLSVPLTVTEGTLSPTSLTIAAGTLTSGDSTLTPDAGAVSNTISITAPPTYDSTNFLGIRWEIAATANPAGGICARTAQVQIALLALVNGATTSNDPGYKACQDIDDTDLAALTGTLDLSSTALTALSSTSITGLSPGDFADLTGITTLTLTGHTGLTELPTNILVGLSALTTLDLSGNALTALPTNPFNGLTGSTLTSIDLSGNALTALPPLSFGSLTALTTLDLGDNALTALNARAFSGATALTSLDLRDNAIASLAGATLAPFAATLTTLHLQGNELTALPDGFFRGATALTTLNAGLQTSTETDISLALKPVFDGGGLRLLLATGAPVALTMSVATTSGTLTPTSLTIAAGATLSSGASTLSYSGAAPTVSISSDPTVANTITGLAWDRTATATPVDGICGRTAQVRDALLALINGDAVLGDSGYVACQDADSSLASLTGTLDLSPDAPALASSQPITALKAGDFAGLPALTGIDLSGNDLWPPCPPRRSALWPP